MLLKKFKWIKCKPNKIWVDKGSEFYNRYIKWWLEKCDIEMYSNHNERKSVIAKRFIRTLINKIYEYMTSISKNTYIEKLDDIVNKYNDTYNRTIKLKSFELQLNTYIASSKEFSYQDSQFKIGDIVRTSKYKNIFVKYYAPKRSEEAFVIKNVVHQKLLRRLIWVIWLLVDNLDVDKLVPVPVGLSKLSDVIKNDAVIKNNVAIYYNTKISEIENKTSVDHDNDK